MTGNMTFQEALKLRLDIIEPTFEQIKDFLKRSPPTLTPGVRYNNIQLEIVFPTEKYFFYI